MQHIFRSFSHISKRTNATPQKFLFGTLANTRHDANGQRKKEIKLGTWVNYGKTTWFIQVRSNFCNRFARSDPN